MAIAIIAQIGTRGWVVGPEALHTVRDATVIGWRFVAVPVPVITVAVVVAIPVVGRS